MVRYIALVAVLTAAATAAEARPAKSAIARPAAGKRIAAAPTARRAALDAMITRIQMNRLVAQLVPAESRNSRRPS